MIRLRAAGHSYDFIADRLNVEKLKTRSGGKWIGATVCKILMRAARQG
jgi:hypothetical protein